MADRDLHTLVLAARANLAKVIRALRVLIDLTAQKVFNPGQLRVPAGNSDGGRWTNGDDVVLVGGGAARRGGFAGASYTQLRRLDVARQDVGRALRRLAERDPTWTAPPTITDNTVEGAIRYNEYVSAAANERMNELDRAGVGGNGGPPLGRAPASTGTAEPFPFNPSIATSAYRYNLDLPLKGDTVAIANMDGKYAFGVSSGAFGYAPEDRAAANEMRDKLVEKYPDDPMKTENLGWKPNDAVYHAETTALLRLARDNGGGLDGATIDMLSKSLAICSS